MRFCGPDRRCRGVAASRQGPLGRERRDRPVPRSRDPDRPRFRARALDAGPRRTSAATTGTRSGGWIVAPAPSGGGWGGGWSGGGGGESAAAGSRAAAALRAAAAPRGVGDAERRRQASASPRRSAPPKAEHGRGDRRRGGAPGERLSIGGAALCADRRACRALAVDLALGAFGNPASSSSSSPWRSC